MFSLLKHRFSLKTTLFTFLISLILLFIFVSPSLAQENSITTFKPPYQQALEAPGMNLSKFSLYNLDNLLASLTKRLIDYPPVANDNNQSLISSLTRATSYLYTVQPVNTASYIAYVAEKINPADPTYAATGRGHEFLAPVLKPWIVFRNIAYIFFIIIFVALGFMIMFRTKLNPQTVISIQHALPKIVVSLILVTFSYAIAGLVVDISYVGGKLITETITRTCPVDNAIRCIFGEDKAWWGKVAEILPSDPDDKIEYREHPIVKTPSVWPLDLIGHYAETAEGPDNIFGRLVGSVASAIVGGLAGLAGMDMSGWPGFFNFIIAMTVIGAAFKIFFSLLNKYVTLIITTMFMPLGFLWGALPGKQNTGSQMFKSLLSASLAFPAVMIFVGIAFYFHAASIVASITFQDLPPFYLSQFEATTEITAGFVTLGMLMIAPQIPAAIDKALETGPGAGAGTAEVGGFLRKLPIIGAFMG